MSIEARFYLVDWAKLIGAIEAVGGFKGYCDQYGDSDQEWLHSIEMPEHESWSTATVAYYVHEAISPHVSISTRQNLESLLLPFGIIEGEAGHDLGIDELFFTVTMSPETVSTILASCSLDYDELQEAYKTHYFPDSNHPLSNFEEFKAYTNGLVQFLQKAQRNGSGIVVSVG